MQDRELVAAIAAGDPGGLGEAYDRYAASLYTYCRFMLPDPRPPAEAADAVADTFVIATAKLPGLRDPDQLGAWLNAVARNECVRRAGAPAEGAMPEISPPAGLRKRVLEECTDSTPAGRAHRVSVTHRAGSFGRTGFPKPFTPSGPRWRNEVRRHPRAAAGVAAVAVAVAAAGIAALLVAGGQHRAQASAVTLGGGDFATSGAASRPASGERSTPGHGPVTPAPTAATARPDADPSTSLVTFRSPAATQSSPSGSSPPAPSPSPSPSPSLSPSPSPPPPPPPPTPGTLRAVPTKLVLAAVKGQAASGTFILTAVGGPVRFAIGSASAKVTASPASGSLGAAGSWVTVTVTVKSLVALDTHLTVDPGNLVITVVFSIKA